MSEKPILFSGAMVRAILDGRKTQTRRVVKRRALDDWDECPYGGIGNRLWVRETFQICSNYHVDCRDTKPPFDDGRPTRSVDDPDYPYWEQCYYRASDACPELLSVDSDEVEQKWRPSIFMPRWASRITLEITDVRVQRLQDISEEDAQAEGALVAEMGDALTVPQHLMQKVGNGHLIPVRGRHYGFQLLWESINAKRAPWASNPWIWALSFRVADRIKA